MKKLIILSCIAVAAMLTVSCEKSLVETSVSKGKTATITIGSPQVEGEVVTKVSFQENSSTKFTWDANDKIHLYSFTKSTSGTNTDWGEFKTTAGGVSADFTGTVPDHTGTSTAAAKGRNLSLFLGSSKWRLSFNIPPTQDGTGLQYCLFAGMPVYDSATNSFEIPTSDDLNSDVLKYRFQLRNALGHFTLPSLTYGITEVKITYISGDTSNPYMTSYNTGARTFGFNLEAPGNGVYKYDTTAGHWSTSLTISNGSELTGDLFFACLQHGANTVLRFELKNSQGKVAARQVTLKNGLSCYNRVSHFGQLPFTNADFTHDNYL